MWGLLQPLQRPGCSSYVQVSTWQNNKYIFFINLEIVVQSWLLQHRFLPGMFRGSDAAGARVPWNGPNYWEIKLCLYCSVKLLATLRTVINKRYIIYPVVRTTTTIPPPLTLFIFPTYLPSTTTPPANVCTTIPALRVYRFLCWPPLRIATKQQQLKLRARVKSAHLPERALLFRCRRIVVYLS